MLTPTDVALLHCIALDAVRAEAEGATPAPLPDPLPEAMTRPGAAFVTLRRGGDLRGCVGHIEAKHPLWKSVQEMAAEAAHDSRFEPVRPEEVPALSIEISVISPMERVTDSSGIRIGCDGLYIRCGEQTGLLLPQVATEWHWDRDTFLAQTCRKAGLPPDAWRDPAAQIFRFTAEII